MFRFLFPGVLFLLLFSSCTMILSTNYPGSPEKSLPKEWLGKYEVITASPFPEKKDSTQPDKEYAIIESTRVTWKTSDGDKIYSLNDSLRCSVMYGQSRYLSLLM